MYFALIEVALDQLVVDETREMSELERIGPLHDDLKYFIEKCGAPGLSAMTVDIVNDLATITGGFLSYRTAIEKGRERVIIAPRSQSDADYILNHLLGSKVVEEKGGEQEPTDVCNVVFFARSPIEDERKAFRSMIFDLYGRIRLRSGAYSGVRDFTFTHNSACCEYISTGPLLGYETIKKIVIAMRSFSMNTCQIRSFQGKPLP